MGRLEPTYVVSNFMGKSDFVGRRSKVGTCSTNQIVFVDFAPVDHEKLEESY